MISSLIFIVIETVLAQSLPDGVKIAFTVGPSEAGSTLGRDRVQISAVSEASGKEKEASDEQ